MICDFCSGPNPRWNCAAISFPVFDIDATSVGDWVACDVCVQLIRDRNQMALARRSSETFSRIHGFPMDVPLFLELHAQFFEHTFGKPTRIQVTS